jgi:hypothetical protein
LQDFVLSAAILQTPFCLTLNNNYSKMHPYYKGTLADAKANFSNYSHISVVSSIIHHHQSYFPIFICFCLVAVGLSIFNPHQIGNPQIVLKQSLHWPNWMKSK